MKKNKVVKILKILAGIYLIIIGGCLLRDITAASPTNKTILAFASIIFILTGIWYAFTSLELKINIPNFNMYLDTLKQKVPKQGVKPSAIGEKILQEKYEKEVPEKRRNSVVMHSLSQTEESAAIPQEEAGQEMGDCIKKPGSGKTVESMTIVKLDSARKTKSADTDQNKMVENPNKKTGAEDTDRGTMFVDMDGITELKFSGSGEISEKTATKENISDFEERKAQIKKKHGEKTEAKGNKKRKSQNISEHPIKQEGVDRQSNPAEPVKQEGVDRQSNPAKPDKKDDKQEV